MARQLRVTYDGAVYHVYARGACKQHTFLSDSDRRSFLELLGVIHERYEVEMHAYCLMTNHYHLLLRTPQGNISEAMRYLNSVYTQRFNRRNGQDGALFRGRFGAQVVAATRYVRALSAYIHLNPVRAGMVEAPDHYRWSSYGAYLDRVRAPAWFSNDLVLDAFGSQEEHRAYIEGVLAGQIDAEEIDLDKPVLAPPGAACELLDNTPRGRETDPSRGRSDPKPTVDRIARLVALECRVAPASVFTTIKGKPNLPRDCAVSIAQSVSGLSQSELAQAFGYSDASSVSSALNRFRTRRRTHDAVAAQASAVEQTVMRGLTPLVAGRQK